MKTVEKVTKSIYESLYNKSVLEVACGCAEFSITASKYAKCVNCIDIDENRLLEEIHSYSNIVFKKMDATDMRFDNASFDTIVMYNAIGHLSDVIEKIVNECIRVLKSDGDIYIITTWKLDRAVINDKLLPFLESKNIRYYSYIKNETLYVRIVK
ncbi:class I SAM-dependent methyltransferase [Sedimentibacter sp. zth1]|uniref:class I SAM-dependent methyltransferase n=1 Tax=Sedimentibacter sp. zth1 TaxID=2816908 RepID=UPI001A92511A|nr:class I SAM-dependent methyltransferase [Sedimentibacter sp. zth1]QSX04873.1 class I SAM-dependent methyltransferase [Sedimentibacter sp. zth1]